jgi:hypothetical protein
VRVLLHEQAQASVEELGEVQVAAHGEEESGRGGSEVE